MLQNRELGMFHIIILLMMSTGIYNHVIILPPLYELAGRDAWISIFFALFIYFFWVTIIYYSVKASKQKNIFEWAKTHFGKKTAYSLYALIFIYLFTMAALTLKDMIIWVNANFLITTPVFLTTLTFLVACFAMASTNIRTITILNGILLPIVVILGFFIASTNFDKKDYSLLFPLFEDGYLPMVKGSFFAGAGLVEAAIVLFLHHHVKSKIKYYHFLIIGIIFAWLTFGPVTGGIATFGPTKSSMQLFPAYEQWALGSLGRFFEHFDFLSIYQWLSGAFVRVSLLLFLIVDLLNVKSNRKKVSFLFIVSLIIFVIILIPIDYNENKTLLGDVFIPGLFILMLFISIFILLLAVIQKRRNSQHEEKNKSENIDFY